MIGGDSLNARLDYAMRIVPRLFEVAKTAATEPTVFGCSVLYNIINMSLLSRELLVGPPSAMARSICVTVQLECKLKKISRKQAN